jgi:hypothetical protein
MSGLQLLDDASTHRGAQLHCNFKPVRSPFRGRRVECDGAPKWAQNWAQREYSQTAVCAEALANCRRIKKKNGAPGEIRTPDLMLRRHSLYPAELRARSSRILRKNGRTVCECSGRESN